MGPVKGPRSAVLAHGLRPRANTADLGSVTGPIRNYLNNKIILFLVTISLVITYHISLRNELFFFELFFSEVQFLRSRAK